MFKHLFKHRQLLPLLLCLLALLPAPHLAARDFTYTYEGQTITYTVLDEAAKTVSTKAGEWNPELGNYGDYSPGNSVTGTLILPATVRDASNVEYTLTEIGVRAFYNCSNLTSVTIPNSVTSIGGNAFNGCSALSAFTIPDAVTLIEVGTFSDCYGLTSITIPDCVTEIGAYAFYQCFGLSSLTIGNSVTKIGEAAFRGCYSLTSLVLPESLKETENSVFAECTGLTTIAIPNSVTKLGWWNFLRCSGLTSVTIGSSVTRIEGGTFHSCTALSSIEIPNTVTEIGRDAFHGCRALTSISIPNSVTKIEDTAFIYCEGLKSVSIGNSVTSIGKNAFYRCSGLTAVTVPNSVAEIKGTAFAACDLSMLRLEGAGITFFPNALYNLGESCTVLCHISEANKAVLAGANSNRILTFEQKYIVGVTPMQTGVKLTFSDNEYFDSSCGFSGFKVSLYNLSNQQLKELPISQFSEQTITGLEIDTEYMLEYTWYNADNQLILPKVRFKTGDSSSLNDPETPAEEATVEGYYDLTGRRHDQPVRGFNIVRYTDGTTRKIVH